jgi:hypothetical protein
MRCVHRAAHGIIPSIPRLDLRFTQGIYNVAGRRRTLITDVPGLTFARTSGGLARNSTRAYAPFAAGVPRITDLGYLSEEPSTNIHPQSGNLQAANWSAIGCTPDVSLVTGCDGAFLTQITATTASHRVVTSSAGLSGLTIGANYTLTYDLAMGPDGNRYGHIGSSNSTSASAVFDLLTGAITGSFGANFVNAFIEQGPGTGLWRCSLVVAAAGTALGMLTGVSAGPTPTGALPSGGSGKIYAGAAQFEAKAFPTSYIVTGATQASRSGDNLFITGLGTALTAPMTMVAWASLSAIDGTSRYLAAASAAGSGANRIIMDRTTLNGGRVLAITANTQQAPVQEVAGKTGARVLKMAGRFDLGTERVAVDGALTASQIAISNPIGLDRIDLAQVQGGGGAYLNGYLQRFFLPGLPTDAQLQGAVQ